MKRTFFLIVFIFCFFAPKIGFSFIENDSIIDKENLNTIIISANKWEQPLKESPVKVVSILTKDIVMQNPQTAADMLAESGEIFVQKSQQGGGSPMIRGFATNRLLISVDGIRMNTAIFRSGNIQNVIALDPFSIDRTEVIYGPGSVIYGSDAIGGVMCFYTMKPEFSYEKDKLIKGGFASRYSSANNELTGHFDVNLAGNKFASRTSISYSQYGDLLMGTNGPEKNYLRSFFTQQIDGKDVTVTNPNPLLQVGTGYNQINMMEKLAFKPHDDLLFTYAIHYSTSSNINRYDNLIRTKNNAPRSAEWYYGPQTWMMNNFSISHSKENRIYDKMNISLAHQYFNESRHDRDFGKSELRNRDEKVHAFSIDFDFLKSLHKKHLLFYGVEMVYNNVNSTGTNTYIDRDSTVKGSSRYPESDWQSYAAYLNYQFKATESLTLHAGTRYNIYQLNATFDTTFYPFPYTTAKIKNGALTGSLGGVYELNKGWVFNLNLSTGFRAPNVDDMGKVFDSEPGVVIVPNPDLKAEYVYNIDGTISKSFGEYLKINFTAFYTWLQDAMVRRDFTLNGMDSITYDGTYSKVQALQNSSSAYIYGIETGFDLKMGHGFGFKARFNYQKGEEELDNGVKSPLRHAAPWFGVAHLTYARYQLKMDLYVAFSGEVSYKNMNPTEQSKAYMYAVDKNANPYSPSWYTLNFKVMHPLANNWLLTAGVENITNQRYRPYSSGMVAAGRNFILSLRANF